MANNPNPQEFNREVDLNKPAEVDDVLSRPKATEYASKEFAHLVPEKDLNNAEAYAKGPAPAKRVTYTSPEIIDRSKALAVNKWGTAVVQGAKLADSAYKEHVESEIEKVKEQADNFWSVESEEALLPTGNAEPPGLKQDASRLYTATNAYKAGKMSETQYLAHMEKEARRLRNKYGRFGYENFVDDTIQKVMGFEPANRLREHLLRQAELAASETPVDVEMAQRAIQYGDAPAAAIANPSAWLSDPQKVAQINAHRAAKVEREQQKEFLTDSNEISNQTSKMAFNLALEETAAGLADVRDMLPDSSLAELEKLTEDLEGDTSGIGAEEAKKIEELRLQASRELRARFVEKYKQYGQHLTVQQMEDLDKYIGWKVDAITNNLDSKKAQDIHNGIVDVAISQAKAGAVRAAPEVAASEALSQLKGLPDIVIDSVEQGLGMSDSAGADVIAKRTLIGLTTPTRATSLRSGLSPTEKGQFDWSQASVLANPKIPDEQKKILADNIFADNWAQEYRAIPSRAEREAGIKDPARAIWDHYTNIDVVKGIAELKDATTTGKYVNWVIDGFAVNNLKTAQELQNHIVNRPNLEFTFDEKTLEFKAVDVGRPSGKTIDWLEDVLMESTDISSLGREGAAIEAVTNMNAELRRLKAITEELGVDPSVVLPLVAARMGLDPDAPKRGSIGLNLYNLLEQGYANWLAGSGRSKDPTEMRPWLNKNKNK